MTVIVGVECNMDPSCVHVPGYKMDRNAHLMLPEVDMVRPRDD